MEEADVQDFVHYLHRVINRFENSYWLVVCTPEQKNRFNVKQGYIKGSFLHL